MKSFLMFFIFTFGIELSFSQVVITRQPFNGPTLQSALNNSIEQASEIQADRDAKAAEQARLEFIQNFIPRDPWRALNNDTNYVKTDGVEFCGKVVDVTKDGVRIQGSYGELFHTSYSSTSQYDYSDFFVANFPFEVVNDQVISEDEHLMAWYVGTYTYSTVNGGSRTIKKLDYGQPCNAPEWYLKQQAAIIAAAQKAAEEKALAAAQKAFKTVAMLATNGEVGMQFSLGIRYLKGDGCETNRDAALYWLQKSAAAGYIEASNKLATLKITDIASEK